MDLSGNILATLRGDTHVTSDNFVQVVLQIIEKRTRKQRCDGSPSSRRRSRYRGSDPDSKKGRIRYSVPLGIDRTLDFFAKAMEGKLDVPCFIENDAKLFHCLG